MSETRQIRVDQGGLTGGIWFIGYLFTIAFAQLTGWQLLIAVVGWPYYLGLALRLLQ
ncbi:MAG TPA: hypothetical protein VIO61_01825 [Anaerolineaceae bacterium]